MTSQCPTCGGKLAHYNNVPNGYCTVHSSWFATNLRCASVFSSEECSDEWNGKDFGYVCPIDGTHIASVMFLDPRLNDKQQSQLQEIHDHLSPEEFDKKVSPIINSDNFDPNRHIPALWNEHLSNCDKSHSADVEDPSDIISRSTEPEDSTTELNGSLGWKEVSPGKFVRGASTQKTAMWYYLKPRWILRRKMQAAVRRKVRSVLAPISAIKSSK